MLKRLFYFVITIVVVLSMFMAASPVFASQGKRNAKGPVVAINHRTSVMIIKQANGSKVALKFSSKTKLKIRG